ncbi:hypothetical protein EYF80_058022 [Liparis tanakae]|uniref:Uncharacterized protein n=1 Tax=Liparis tanakae TaxID=230148 RepID=A0A4Z2ET64_9TELE|nr:hypothetical protein EYF80_058022 [Liparis tanakae]
MNPRSRPRPLRPSAAVPVSAEGIKAIKRDDVLCSIEWSPVGMLARMLSLFFIRSYLVFSGFTSLPVLSAFGSGVGQCPPQSGGGVGGHGGRRVTTLLKLHFSLMKGRIQTPPEKPLKDTSVSSLMDNERPLSTGARRNAHDEDAVSIQGMSCIACHLGQTASVSSSGSRRLPAPVFLRPRTCQSRYVHAACGVRRAARRLSARDPPPAAYPCLPSCPADPAYRRRQGGGRN